MSDNDPASSSRLLGDPEAAGKGEKSLPRVATRVSKEATATCVGFARSWFSRKFATGCAILFPVVVTFYVTWWFLETFDGIFSPLFRHFFGINVFGLGFLTSMAFITGTGLFFSSYAGSSLLVFGEWLIRRLPLVKHIYSASKQVSAALNPEHGGTKAFQECVLIKHPRHGEYALGFITGRTCLRCEEGTFNLNCVYVPTNHVYVGDIFMLRDEDVLHTNLSVREGLEVVVSVGMAMPPSLTQHARRGSEH